MTAGQMWTEEFDALPRSSTGTGFVLESPRRIFLKRIREICKKHVHSQEEVSISYGGGKKRIRVDYPAEVFVLSDGTALTVVNPGQIGLPAVAFWSWEEDCGSEEEGTQS